MQSSIIVPFKWFILEIRYLEAQGLSKSVISRVVIELTPLMVLMTLRL